MNSYGQSQGMCLRTFPVSSPDCLLSRSDFGVRGLVRAFLQGFVARHESGAKSPHSKTITTARAPTAFAPSFTASQRGGEPQNSHAPRLRPPYAQNAHIANKTCTSQSRVTVCHKPIELRSMLHCNMLRFLSSRWHAGCERQSAGTCKQKRGNHEHFA